MEPDRCADELVDSLRIPTLPTSVQKMQKLLARENVALADVAAALACDPPLAAKALRIANSVQYGMREKTMSIPLATSLLGLRSISSIVLRAGVISLYSEIKDTDGFSVHDFWKHSILTAHVAEDLARQGRRRATDLSPQAYYVCGLLHDMGRIVLYDNFGEDYIKLLRERPSDVDEIQAETAGLLGLNHADMGSVAAAIWRLPDPIPDIIRFHHRSQVNIPAGDVVRVVACADEIAEAVASTPNFDPKRIASLLKNVPPGFRPEALLESIRHAESCADQIEV